MNALSKPLALALALAGLCAAGTAPAATRAGLFYTQEEIAVWQNRSNTGPFVKAGDFAQGGLAAFAPGNYSPAQWERVVAAADAFRQNPAADRWTNYYAGSGCYPSGSQANSAYDTGEKGAQMVKAAFYSLVKSDAGLASLVRQELLGYAANPQLDFSNTARWCHMGDSAPGFQIAEWLTRLLISTDMLAARGYLTAADKATLSQWFGRAATYMRSNYDPDLDRLFVQRSGSYPLADWVIRYDSKELLYSSASGLGPYAHAIHRWYNNRRWSMVAFVGLYGVFSGNAAFVDSATRYSKEWLMFAIRPSGIGTELHRGIIPTPADGSFPSGNPYKGANYVWSSISNYMLFADALARSGDPTLYRFETTQGTAVPEWGNDNTAVTDGGPPKSFLRVLLKALEFQNGQFSGYATADPNYYAGPERWRFKVDGRASLTTTNKTYVFDTWLALANRWYGDPAIKANYTRTAPGTTPLPAHPSSIGPSQGYTFPGATLPAPLFMFHDTGVDPYPQR